MVRSPKAWRLPLLHAAAVCLLVLALFYFWFAVADRYAVFLYNHLGAAPFDGVTRSRYWMSGLVASGSVLVLYTASNWLWGGIATLRQRRYQPPAWSSVWLLAAPLLLVGIPLITMTQNQPTMPFSVALQCTAATLAGLALALAPASLAVQQPFELLWALCYGAGMAPALLLLRALELPGQGIITVAQAVLVALGGVLAGALWLVLLFWARVRTRRPPPGAATILAAGLALSYLLAPLVHHLFFTPPGYRYISASANFFATSPAIQMLSLVLAALLAGGSVHLQRKLTRSPAPAAP